MTARQCFRWAGPLSSAAIQRIGGIGSWDGQGGSADTRGTASWDGLTEPLQESDRCRLLVTGIVTAGVAVTAGAAVMVGGLCPLGTGLCLCLALGDLLSLRAVTGEVEVWCLRFPGRTVVVACTGCTAVLGSVSEVF